MTESAKLLASDYDKTFFYKSKPDALPANLKAVSHWQQHGHKFAISTGRDAASMMYEREHRDVHFDYLIALNGSFIIDHTDTVIFKQAIPTNIAKRLVEQLRGEFNDELIISNGFDGCNFTNRTKSEHDATAREVYQRNSVIYSRSIEQALEHEVLLVGCLTQNDAHAKTVQSRILSEFSDEVEVFINLNYINIVPKNISKASGLRRAIQHANIAHSDVVVVGDDYNDIPMVEAFRGFAVPNARHELISVAEGTVTNVAQLIAQLIDEQ